MTLTYDPSGRECTYCCTHKPWSDFTKKTTGTHGRASRCRTCGKKTATYYTPAQVRDQNLRHKYGIGQAEYLALLEQQDGHCALCPRRAEETTKGVLEVDHCYDTGRVRGLLCIPCNTAVGRLGDTADSLRRVVGYLDVQ